MTLQKVHSSIILATATLIFVSAMVFALLSTSQRISTTGNVKAVGVEVYTDSSCNKKVSLVEWGSLNPGETKNVTLYIRNEGNVAVVLSMTADNWNPTSISSYMTLNWNRAGYRITPNAGVEAILSLSVSRSITGFSDFTFDIVITGTESV